jgi:hypothetical protein
MMRRVGVGVANEGRFAADSAEQQAVHRRDRPLHQQEGGKSAQEQ